MSSSKDTFFERWFKPLLSMKPRNLSNDEYFTQILNINSRPISGYRARVNFSLVGLLCADDVPGRPDLSPDKTTLGLVARGDVVWARTDDTQTTWVDVEHKARMWQIPLRDWNQKVRPLLTPVVAGQEEM